MVPPVGSRSRITVRPSVDLPQPDSPTRPRVSPALISRSTPSTACTWPTVRCSTPEATGNHILRSVTATSGSLAVHAIESCLGTAVASGTLELRPGLRHPTGRTLRVADLEQRRHVPAALLDPEGTPRVERAADRQVDEVRGQALDRLQRLVALGVEARDRAQQGPRVWMLRVGEDVRGRPGLDDLAGV